MSPLILVAIALLTYGSRAAAVVLLRRPGPAFEAVLARMPAPNDGGALVGGPTLWASAGALLASPARSLLIWLIAGAAAYPLGAWLGWG